jgi:hypothetical protein
MAYPEDVSSPHIVDRAVAFKALNHSQQSSIVLLDALKLLLKFKDEGDVDLIQAVGIVR